MEEMGRCPDCGVPPGTSHLEGCDVERCSACKGQRLQCDCKGHDPNISKWDGIWPGTEECYERGWFARTNEGPTDPAYGYWAPCTKDTPGAIPDMNRLAYFKRTGVDGCYDVSAHRAIHSLGEIPVRSEDHEKVGRS